VSPSVAVIGGGISGLAAAHRLRTVLGPAAAITVFEQSSRLGGVLRTVTLAGHAFDVGAEAFLTRRPEVTDLLGELGLTDQLVHPAGVPANVRTAGRSLPLPARTVMGIPSTVESMRQVLSAEGLARLAAEPERALRWDVGSDVSVGELVQDRFGVETVTRSVDPLLGGVYSGRAESLGVRAAVPTLAAALDRGAPSLLAAAASAVPEPRPGIPVFGAVREGYGRLISALRDSADPSVRLACAVTELGADAHRWWVRAADGARECFDAVVVAVPAPAVRKLLRTVAPAASHAADGISLASCVVVGLAFDANRVQLPRTSGLLVATGEPLHAKALTHSSRKWPHLGGEDVVLLRASLGRYGDTTALQIDDAEVVSQVRADLAAVHGITAPPLDVMVQRWGGGLPQYAPGHLERVAALTDAVAAQPGLAVAGSMLHGVGVPACIATGRAAAERVVHHISAPARDGGVVAP